MTALVLDPPAQTPQNAAAAPSLESINNKLDALTLGLQSLADQVQWLTDRAIDQKRRMQEWDDLLADGKPILREAYNVAVAEMQELEPYVSLDDVLFTLKRLLRNTRNLNLALDYLESGVDLTHDVNRMAREMMTSATDSLQTMEEKGYFGFVRQGWYVMDKIVTSFSEEDVKQLGDNVVLILNTVKALTQPEMMNLIGNLTQGFHEAEASVDEGDIGYMSLLRQMRDPDVRRGLAVTLATLKRVSMQSKQ